jgi:hypothetical protein
MGPHCFRLQPLTTFQLIGINSVSIWICIIRICIYLALYSSTFAPFQETRHINAALIQHITFNEFLPMVLGKEVMHQHDLVLLKDGYFDGYDQYTNPSAASGFTSSAFR